MSVQKFTHKVKRIFEFFSLLNVEPFILFLMISSMIKIVPSSQLIQDKICLNKFNMTSTYCLNLPQMTAEEDIFNVKTQILKEVTKYSLYSNLIGTIPTLLGTLLIGSWIDKYRGAKKAIMIASALAGIMEGLIAIANIYYYDICKNIFESIDY